ncbi:MAG: flap endonuclease Xni [Motiliproteus sp.]|nr:flap endonuclease Xni [Motiliproteus sp.]
MKHLLLIDGLNLIRRVHAAVPGDGVAAVNGAMDSCLHSLKRIGKQFKPTHGVCCFDGPELSWRHLDYPEYKAGRKPMADELRDALPDFRQRFADAGLASLAIATVEADDLAATLSTKMLQVGGRVTLVSTDKGYCQLLPLAEGDQLCLWDAFNRRAMDQQGVLDKFGVEPGQLTDYWGLTGDSTNEIKGVDGVGAKTAQRLISEYGSLDEIYANIEQIGGKLAEKLVRDKKQAYLCKRLVSLAKDLDLGCRLSDFRYVPADL